MSRDFTYIDDIVEGVFRCCYKPATPDLIFIHINPMLLPHLLRIGYSILNSHPVKLLDFINILKQIWNKSHKAI